MPRTVALWTGRTDDTPAPQRVRVRVFERCDGRCHRCGRKIRPGDHWTLEHLVALINGGRNAEDNLSVTCDWCLPIKNAEDVAEKAKVAAVKASYVLPRPPSRLRGQGFRKAVPQRTASTPSSKQILFRREK